MWLKSFVIGSSIIVMLPFLLGVLNRRDRGETKYSYENYSIIAPIYLGLMAVIAYWFRLYLGMSLRESLLLISVISPTIVFLIVYFNSLYNFTTTEEWCEYALNIYFKHFLIFNIVIYYLEVYLC